MEARSPVKLFRRECIVAKKAYPMRLEGIVVQFFCSGQAQKGIEVEIVVAILECIVNTRLQRRESVYLPHVLKLGQALRKTVAFVIVQVCPPILLYQ